MLKFNFPEKGPELVSPSHFVYDFSRKIIIDKFAIIDRGSIKEIIFTV